MATTPPPTARCSGRSAPSRRRCAPGRRTPSPTPTSSIAPAAPTRCNPLAQESPLEHLEPTALPARSPGGAPAFNVSDTSAPITFVGQVFQAVAESALRCAFYATGTNRVVFQGCELRGNLILTDSGS